MSERIILLCQRLVQFWFRLRLRLTVQGLENIPRSGAVILASNHVSGYDPVLLGSLMPRVCHYLAKKELFDNPWLRPLIQFFRAIPVDRSGHSPAGVRRIKRVLDQGRLVLLFPEGTRSKTGRLGEPKIGVGMLACMTDAIVVPAYIDGLFRAKASFFRRPPVTVRFGSPIHPKIQPGGLANRKEKYLQVSRTIYDEIRRLAGPELSSQNRSPEKSAISRPTHVS